MKCSICKCVLIVNGQAPLETLDEHVSGSNYISLKDRYLCSNPLCLSHKYECCWNDYGDFYGGVYKTIKPEFAKVPDDKQEYEMWNFFHISDEGEIFDKKMHSAIGSPSRQSETEIYKTGLEKQKYLSPALCLWFLQPVIEYVYKADMDGNVLSKKNKLFFLKKDNGHYCIHYTAGIKMFFFCYKKHIKAYKYFKKNPNVKYAVSDLFKAFKYEKWDKRWWKTFSTFLFRMLYFRTRIILNNKYQDNE